MASFERSRVTNSSRSQFETGKWDSVSNWLGKLPASMEEAGREVTRRVATSMATRVKQRIKSQSYGHSPLKPSYVESKVARGLDPRILMATQNYVNSIDVYEDGEVIFCGVPDTAHPIAGVPLSVLSDWLENGTDKMIARPHFAPEFDLLHVQFAKELGVMGLRYLGILSSSPGE